MTETEKPKPPRKKKGGSQKGRRINSLGTLTKEGLTVEQEAYCRARATGMSLDEAMVASDCKRCRQTVQTKWEKNPKIRTRIAELSDIATQNAIIQTGLNREWVLTRLMTVADRCMQTEPVLDNQGNPTGEYKFDSAGATKALKMLGDTLGMFKQQEIKTDEFAELSDDEIARIAAQLATETGITAFIEGTKA